jgi:4'-phosphopantetheinyl transferase
MKLYTSYVKDFSVTEYERCFSLMSDDRKASVQSYRNEYDKKRTVLGEHLARKAISEFLGIEYSEIRFGRDEKGRPFAIGLDVDFNISHSNELVVCAVSNERIGVDVEKYREKTRRQHRSARLIRRKRQAHLSGLC